MNSRLTKEDEMAYQFFVKHNEFVLRKNNQYTYIENMDKEEIYCLLEYEIVKRRLIPIQNLIDYEDYTYLKIKEIDKKLKKERNKARLILSFTNYNGLTTSIKSKLSIFRGLKKGSNNGKLVQNKIADFLFIYDCLCWGLKNNFIISELSNYYGITAKYIDNRTLRKYKKLALDMYEQPTERTLVIFNALYNENSTAIFIDNKLN